MPVKTRNQHILINPERQINVQELDSFKDELNIAVVKGLRSITQRVSYSAKIQVSRELHQFLQLKYSLSFRARECGDLLDDFRVVRGYFKNKRDF